MKTGIELISHERWEQIYKHGRLIEDDVDINEGGELAIAAVATITGEDGKFPAGWDLVAIQKICDKPYYQRLIIAGAFIAAEIDRLNASGSDTGNS